MVRSVRGAGETKTGDDTGCKRTCEVNPWNVVRGCSPTVLRHNGSRWNAVWKSKVALVQAMARESLSVDKKKSNMTI